MFDTFNLEFFLGIVNNAIRTSKILTAENFKNQHVVTKGRWKWNIANWQKQL